MKILVVGSGGREHALVWKIAQSPRVDAVLAAPGSAGMAGDATCFPDVAAGDIEAVTELARSQGVELVVVGPEDPLAAGIADRLRKAGIATFGPSAAAAQLEGSKAFAKGFMARHGIPTADFEVFDDLAAALAHVRGLPRPGFCVVKADGLAAGKGVFVCDDAPAAEQALSEIMSDRRFGEAGARVVIEERLDTPGAQEASYYAISDGERIVTLAAAQDHKRALDGDRGENTGGMGAYSPPPVVSEAVERRILAEIVRPTIAGMAEDGAPFGGVLFVGLMVDAEGAPRVIEYNVRFGDPETQPLLVRMQSDLVPILEGAATGRLDPAAAPVFGDAAVCVVLASGGYPRSYETGKLISGLEEAGAMEGVVVFHAGTRLVSGDPQAAQGAARSEPQAPPKAESEMALPIQTVFVRAPARQAAQGAARSEPQASVVRAPARFETSGGRVLGVTALGSSVAEARERAYAAAVAIDFEGRHLRSDIAARAL